MSNKAKGNEAYTQGKGWEIGHRRFLVRNDSDVFGTVTEKKYQT